MSKIGTPHLTQIPGLPPAESAIPGMAFFAGTGPEGKRCEHCQNYGYYRESGSGKSYHVNKCNQFYRMMKEHGPNVKPYYKACKYFEERKKT